MPFDLIGILPEATRQSYQQILEYPYYDIGQAWGLFYKGATAPYRVHALSGHLILSDSSWLMLTVPNALVRGTFDALDDPGWELPLKDGRLNAHISVMSPEEIALIGGPERISERGHSFHFTLGPVKAVIPKDWDGISKVLYITVDSPDLRNLRKSYGLEPLRNGYDHHITIAIRRKGITQHNDVSKAAATTIIKRANDDGAPYRERAEVFAIDPKRRILGGRWKHDRTFSVPGGGVDPGEDIAQAALRELLEESGYLAVNPRLSPVPPVINPWTEEERARLPEDKRRFKGSRTHFVLADLLSDKPERTENLDAWGAQNKGLHDLQKALQIHTTSDPTLRTPALWEARKQVLESLVPAKSAADKSEPEPKDDDSKLDAFDDLQQLFKDFVDHLDDQPGDPHKPKNGKVVIHQMTVTIARKPKDQDGDKDNQDDDQDDHKSPFHGMQNLLDLFSA